MMRIRHIVSVALITAGLVLIADVGLTLAWKEPVSAVYGSIRQGQASGELDSVSESFLTDPDVEAAAGAAGRDPSRQAARLAGLFAKQLENLAPIGRIEIPSIGAGYVVVEGTDTAALQRGPGHYPKTVLPGQGSTIGIAGHRTTYLAPFNRIDDIDLGDKIILKMPYGNFTYDVTNTKIVDPSQTEIVRDVGRERLVLTACHPLYSAAQRYAIFADLVDIELKSNPNS